MFKDNTDRMYSIDNDSQRITVLCRLGNKSKTSYDGDQNDSIQHKNMYISLLQIQFSPLRQYAYVPVPNSQKIEGKSLSVMNYLLNHD